MMGGAVSHVAHKAAARHPPIVISLHSAIVAGGLLGQQPWLFSGNRGVERPTNGNEKPEPQRRPVPPNARK